MQKVQEAAPLRSTSGFVSITPECPVPLAGYADRTAPCTGIADELEANVVILKDRGPPFVIITFDLLYVGDLLRQKLATALQPWVRSENLFLAASHTHFAPATDPTLPKIGAVDPTYIGLVVERVSALVRSLLQNEFKSIEVAVGQAQADNAVNRRRQGWRIIRHYPFLCKRVWMRPNRQGVKDETIRILRFGADAVIWNYGCHPVFMPRMNHVSADFVGVVRTALRRRLGANTAVLFWQGFAGNIYPSFASTMVGLTARLNRLLFRTTESISNNVWSGWANRLAGHVVEASLGAIKSSVHGPITSKRSTFPVQELLGNGTTPKLLGTHKISIGSEIHILGISAEPVAEYAGLVKKSLNNNNLFCVSCLDGVFGYLPTAQMVREGGYEGNDFLPYFSLPGQFSTDIEQIVQDKLRTTQAG